LQRRALLGAVGVLALSGAAVGGGLDPYRGHFAAAAERPAATGRSGAPTTPRLALAVGAPGYQPAPVLEATPPAGQVPPAGPVPSTAEGAAQALPGTSGRTRLPVRDDPDSDSVQALSDLAPLPACDLADVQTPLASLRDWRLTLVDWAYEVPASYVPNDLVSTAEAGLNGGGQVRSVVVADLRALATAAADAGIGLGVLSGYRGWEEQSWTFWSWVNQLGYSYAIHSSARPGHSEHQLGLAIDFQEAGGPEPWAYYDFSRDTATGRWLAANAWQYGFVMSYPVGKVAVTCYGFEPWHYRYVGRAEAAAVRDSGLTLREWLWQRQPSQENAAPTPTPSPATAPTSDPAAARRLRRRQGRRRKPLANLLELDGGLA
jgi:LAS superfamily LD-carboxypeptidase LdcB